MKKYKAILIALIIVIAGFFVYDNCFKPWNEAEKGIDRYMEVQGVSQDDIKEVTKEKSKKASYDGILYKVHYKDDPGYEYHYFYSDNYHALHVNKVMLQIYDLNNDNKLLRNDEELSKVKYPPIYIDK